MPIGSGCVICLASHFMPLAALAGSACPRSSGWASRQLSLHSWTTVYLDLENPHDLEKLEDARGYLEGQAGKLVILDEVQRAPGLFQTLRGLIDDGIQEGRTSGRCLLLGSASIDLLRQSGESLAGRIAYAELAPLDVLDLP